MREFEGDKATLECYDLFPVQATLIRSRIMLYCRHDS